MIRILVVVAMLSGCSVVATKMAEGKLAKEYPPSFLADYEELGQGHKWEALPDIDKVKYGYLGRNVLSRANRESLYRKGQELIAGNQIIEEKREYRPTDKAYIGSDGFSMLGADMAAGFGTSAGDVASLGTGLLLSISRIGKNDTDIKTMRYDGSVFLKESEAGTSIEPETAQRIALKKITDRLSSVATLLGADLSCEENCSPPITRFGVGQTWKLTGIDPGLAESAFKEPYRWVPDSLLVQIELRQIGIALNDEGRDIILGYRPTWASLDEGLRIQISDRYEMKDGTKIPVSDGAINNISVLGQHADLTLFGQGVLRQVFDDESMFQVVPASSLAGGNVAFNLMYFDGMVFDCYGGDGNFIKIKRVF